MQEAGVILLECHSQIKIEESMPSKLEVWTVVTGGNNIHCGRSFMEEITRNKFLTNKVFCFAGIAKKSIFHLRVHHL